MFIIYIASPLFFLISKWSFHLEMLYDITRKMAVGFDVIEDIEDGKEEKNMNNIEFFVINGSDKFQNQKKKKTWWPLKMDNDIWWNKQNRKKNLNTHTQRHTMVS